MRCASLAITFAALVLSGCATPHQVDESGKTAMVTYKRDISHEHYFSELSGEVVEKDGDVTGPLYSSKAGRIGTTTVFSYKSESCTNSPRIMGIVKGDARGTSVKVKAGVPLVNTFRTRYQTCERDCHKHFYTSSVFTPEENARYEVVVEPIDGATVYKIVGKEMIQLTDVSEVKSDCRY